MPPNYIVPWRPPVLSKAHCFEILHASHSSGTPAGRTRWILETFATFLFTGHLADVCLADQPCLAQWRYNVLYYPVTLNFNFYRLGSLKEHLCASVSFRMPLLCRPIDLWLKGWKSIKMRRSSWGVCLFRLVLMQKPVFTY